MLKMKIESKKTWVKPSYKFLNVNNVFPYIWHGEDNPYTQAS